MNNLKLKGLFAENYASFAERIDFTTGIDTSKKEYLENTFTHGDHTLNKVSFLYGANGSGKTFFCKILREIKRILEWSPLTATNIIEKAQLSGADAPLPYFSLDLEYQNKPTTLGVEIILDGITYHYEFGIYKKKIVYELLTKKYRRTEVLLERTSPSFKSIVLRSELKDFDATKRVVKDEALCLSMAAFLNNPLAAKIVNAIYSIIVINMTAPRIRPSSSRDSFSQTRVEKYTDILKRADPTLRGMNILFDEVEETVHQITDQDDFENREVIEKRITVSVEAEHAVFHNGIESVGTPLEFFTDESLGTIKLFTALPHLFDILEQGGIMILDELENGLHLSLAREIIQLFISSQSNPNHAQLICTSHQPMLVDGNIRRDQVWITRKDSYGKCTLHRMSELKSSRAKVNLVNRILVGAFGCNPELFFENTQT